MPETAAVLNHGKSLLNPEEELLRGKCDEE
jgi:hypothetical protein